MCKMFLNTSDQIQNCIRDLFSLLLVDSMCTPGRDSYPMRRHGLPALPHRFPTSSMCLCTRTHIHVSESMHQGSVWTSGLSSIRGRPSNMEVGYVHGVINEGSPVSLSLGHQSVGKTSRPLTNCSKNCRRPWVTTPTGWPLVWLGWT